MNKTIFGPRANDMLLLGHDNRISLWDVELNKRRRVYIEKKHLSHTYVSCAWRHGNKDDLGTLAVGCSDGIVLIWDLVRGVVSTVIGNSDEIHGEISDVAFSRDGKSVYASSEKQSTINEYKVSDGSFVKSMKGHKKGTSRLAGNPKTDALAVGGSSLKILEVSSGNKRKLEGHFTGSLQTMCFTQCGRYLVCCARNSQEVVLYDVHADASSSPIKVFSAGENPRKIVAKSDTSQKCVWILCLLDTGGCNMFKMNLDSKELGCCSVHSQMEVLDGIFTQPSREKVGGGSNESECCVSFALKASGATELIFVSSAFSDNFGELKSQVELGANESNVVSQLSTDSSTPPITNGPTVIGPLETGPNKRPLSSALEVDEPGLSSEKRARKGSDSGTEADLTMEQRLRKLTSEISVLDSSRGNEDKFSGGSGASGGPTSDSLVTLLDQSLQAGDDALLEQCIGCEDPAIIEATTQRLPTGRVVSFMKRLVSKFEKRPSRGILLTRWLAAVLRSHTAFLISVPDLSSQLDSLSAMLEQRLSTYTKLTALGGRLDLLLSQVSAETSRGASQVDGALPSRTVIVPEENEEDEE